MDADRFERVVRSLTIAASRRQTIGGIAGVLFGGALGHVPSTASAKGKKGKGGKGKKKKRVAVAPPTPQCPASCPPCQQCFDGRTCTLQPNGTPCGDISCQGCRGGVCINLPDETSCQGTGLCGSGACNQPPDCIGHNTAGCNTTADCCNGTCSIGVGGCVGQGGNGARCKVDFDCTSDNCVAYRCRP